MSYLFHHAVHQLLNRGLDAANEMICTFASFVIGKNGFLRGVKAVSAQVVKVECEGLEGRVRVVLYVFGPVIEYPRRIRHNQAGAAQYIAVGIT